MSIKFMNMVWDMELEPAEKLVLLSLADQANDDGECWPSVRNMCKRSCLSERTVQRVLRTLESMGVLFRELKAGHSNIYRINATPVMVTPRHGGTPVMVTGEGCHGDGGGGVMVTPRTISRTKREPHPPSPRGVGASANQPRLLRSSPAEQPEGFAEFWLAYPRKAAKGDALKAWVKLTPDAGLQRTILNNLGLRAASEEWRAENGRWIPYPASYLNGMRWEDEISGPVAAKAAFV